MKQRETGVRAVPKRTAKQTTTAKPKTRQIQFRTLRLPKCFLQVGVSRGDPFILILNWMKSRTSNGLIVWEKVWGIRTEFSGYTSKANVDRDLGIIAREFPQRLRSWA